MTILYVVEYWVPHEFTETLGIYSTLENAQEAMDRWAKHPVIKHYKRNLSIEEWVLDKDREL